LIRVCITQGNAVRHSRPMDCAVYQLYVRRASRAYTAYVRTRMYIETSTHGVSTQFTIAIAEVQGTQYTSCSYKRRSACFRAHQTQPSEPRPQTWSSAREDPATEMSNGDDPGGRYDTHGGNRQPTATAAWSRFSAQPPLLSAVI
jgi:hypothetical protein